MRVKITLVLCLVLACYIPLYFLLFERIIFPRFVEIERERAVENVDRCTDALRDEIRTLAELCAGWAVWDDLDAFARAPSPGFARAFLSPPLAVDTLHLIAQGAPDGSVAWATAFAGGRVSAEARARLLDAAPELAELLVPDGSSSDVSGVIDTPSGPMLVATQALARPRDGERAAGVLLMARSLDEALLSQLNTRAHTAFRLLRADPAVLDPLESEALAALLAGREIFLRVDFRLVHGFKLVRDVAGRPSLLLHASFPEQVTAKGKDASNMGVASSILAASIILIVLLWMLDARLVAPLSRLTRHVRRVRQHRDVSARLNSTRQDEIGVLAREFDGMLEEIEKLHRELSQQAYRLGMSEAAAGVLHDIRNTLTPLPWELENLQKTLSALPMERLATAAAQLPGEASPQRAQALAEFLRLGLEDAGERLAHCGERLNRLFTLTADLDGLLNAYDPSQDARRALSAVDVAGALDHALALLPGDVADALLAERGPGLAQAPPVLADPLILAQVLAEILSFATALAPREGRTVVAVDAQPEPLGHRTALRVDLAVRGRGLDDEGLDRLFQRRPASGQSVADGRGLHWCANAVNAMGGRVRARSQGPDTGLVLQLTFILASAKSGNHGQ